MAFVYASHHRLGEVSAANGLSSELFEKICSYIPPEQVDVRDVKVSGQIPWHGPRDSMFERVFSNMKYNGPSQFRFSIQTPYGTICGEVPRAKTYGGALQYFGPMETKRLGVGFIVHADETVTVVVKRISGLRVTIQHHEQTASDRLCIRVDGMCVEVIKD